MDILHPLRESGEAMLARAGFVLIEANEVQGVAFLTARARDGDGIWLLLFARSQEELRTSGILHGVDTVKAQLPARVEVRVTLLTPEPFDVALPYEQMSLADLRRGAEPQQGARVDTLSVFSTGVFNYLKLRFPAQGPAVLVGQNARGKSTLLRALARALSWWVAEAERPGQEGVHADDLDIYRSAPESRVGITLSLGPTNVAWSVTSPRRGQAPKVPSELDALQTYLRGHPARPLFRYFPARRSLSGREPTLPAASDWAPMDGYARALGDEGGASLSELIDWMAERQEREAEERQKNPRSRDRDLTLVGWAVSQIVDGLGRPKLRGYPRQLWVNKGNQQLNVAQLSDGERGLVAIVGDLARRLCQLQGDQPDPLAGHGVVIIDEIEQHLHPRWQRTVLAKLAAIFPSVQWIVATHSPLVVSEVPAANVLLLRVDPVTAVSTAQAAPRAYGADANSVLEETMEGEARPTEVQRRLQEVELALDARAFSTARPLLETLKRDLGSDDPALIRLESLLHFLED